MWKFVLILAIAASLLLTSHAGSEDSTQYQCGDNNECPEDQELSECPDASCLPLTCDEVGYPISGCGTSSPCPGYPDCVCKDGNVFDDCGNCISPTQCPSCGGDKNAVQGCGNNCGKKCSDLVEKQSICILSCLINGCDCKDNFYYDSNKKRCVPAEECTSICSGPNEQYDKCPGCSPQTCATRNNIYNCPMIPANKTGLNCTPACRCKEGYFRNSKNICVAACECDECPEDQVYSDCPDASCAALTCAEVGFQKKNCGTSDPCPGQPGCVCKSGYVKDANGNCISSSECPSCGGDNNAIPGCSNYCGRTCADIGKNGTSFCPEFCEFNGCACKPNYWYDNNTKKCVKANECTPTCKGNEEFSSCSNGLCYVQDCKDKGKTRPCPPMAPGSCIPGCVCPKGYLRKNGECVPEDQCDSIVCKENEVYSNCTNGGCGAKYCSQLGYTQPCVDYNSDSCVKGCACIDGYVRDQNGKCIPSDQCPSCGGDENAVQGCGNNCGKKCSDLVKKQSFCTLSCKLNGCDCKDNFYYDSNKKRCVCAEECTSICSGPNEEYDKCPGCSPQTCATRNNIYHCPMIPANNTGPNCTPACRCKEGYFRNSENICVAASECDDCPEDQVYSNCPDASCAALTCAEVGFQKKNCGTSDPCPGQPGCVCKSGYVKDANGNCITPSECPCGGDNNAIPGCSNYCGRTCADIGKNGTTVCPQFCVSNGCACKPNYWYDNNTKKCVKANECTPTCKGNEEFSSCSNGLCYVQDCKDKGKTKFCPPMVPGSCIPGCVCPKGYLRKNGDCVPEDQCDAIVCKENEVYSNCTNGGCGAKYCSQLGYPQPCVDYNSDSCVKGCACIDGYVRDENGKCIPSDQCPSCGGDPNAQPGCGINCGRHCSNYKNKHPICPSIACIINRCDCRPNFVYDDNLQKCVSPKDCTPTCNENEVFSNCTNGGCEPKKCSQLGFEVPCPKLNPAYCEKGCVCEPGYVRAENGTCIPSDQCPSCGGDTNAQPGCGINCGRHCSNYKNEHPICPRIVCLRNKCDCRKDYVYDDNIKKCVFPKDCTPECKINEEYSNCSNGLCRFQDCTQYGDPIPFCPRFDMTKCKGGCICQNKYLRNPQGVCVPQEECPSYLCPKANHEVYSNCTNGASSQVGTTTACPKIDRADCIKGCICEEGYLRAKDGTCIPKKECPTPQPQCDEGEIYSTCSPVSCDAEYCPKNRNAPQSCPTPKKCPKKGKCVCGFNSHRDRKTKKCIPTRNCPPFACNKCNEVYDSCPPVCPGQTCKDFLNNATCSKFPIRIVVACKPACRCKPNHYRNSKGDCVSGQKCKDEQAASNYGCSSTPTNPDQNQNPGDAASDELLLEQGSNAFSLKFLSELVKENPEVSVFSSPASCLTPLAELAYYSKGATATELLDVMNLKSKDQIPLAFPGYLNSFQVAEGTVLDLGNRIYVADPYKLSDSFKSVSENVFNATAETIDFNQSSQAASTINKWVSDATNGKITNLVSADMFNSLTRLVLANAIYFKGTWKTEFNPSNTQSSDFYVNADKTVQVQMMYQKNKFQYSNNNDIGAQVVEIPYLDTNVTFVMILPNEQNGLPDVLNKLQNPSISSTFLSGLSTETVKLYMPQMEVSTTSNLINILKPIGVKTIFTSNAELSGMIVPDESLYVTDATQKAYVLVNEKGSEAAAANAVVVSTRAAVVKPLEIVVRADHPFIFCIKVRNLHLFLGTYYG